MTSTGPLVFSVLALVACGGGGDDVDAPSAGDGASGGDGAARTDAPADASTQRRVRATFTVGGSYVDSEGAPHDLSLPIDVDLELNATPPGCARATDSGAGFEGPQFRRFLVAGCTDDTAAMVSWSVPYLEGSYPGGGASYPSACVELSLPVPDNRWLRFCSADDVALEITAVTGPPLGAAGTLDGFVTFVPDEGIAGCPAGPRPGCPDAPPATLAVTGSFEVTNTD